VWRTVLGVVLLAIGAWVAINALVTTEPERVEAEVERLLDLAREGGEGAADEILGALAEDYHGDYPRERIESYLDSYVGQARIRRLTTGNYKAVWKSDEIIVPILRIDAETHDGRAARTILRVTFAERDGEWKVVNVGRWRLER
jgi:hypothetical protein